MKIPNGARVHTIPLDAMDSAVPLMYPPPTVVAGNEKASVTVRLNHKLNVTKD